MSEWKNLVEKLNQLVRPQTHPLAVKLLKDRKELPPAAQQPKSFGIKMTICQAITTARRWEMTMGLTPQQVSCAPALLAFGWAKPLKPEEAYKYFLDMGYFKTVKAVPNTAKHLPILPFNEYKAMSLTPLAQAQTTPDVILIYGTPGQISRLIQGAIYHEGGIVASESQIGLSCASEIITPLQKNRAHVVIPGRGERVIAMAQDEEMAFALPANQLETLIEGLEAGQKTGITYPTPFYQFFQAMFPGPMTELYEKLELAE